MGVPVWETINICKAKHGEKHHIVSGQRGGLFPSHQKLLPLKLPSDEMVRTL